MNTNALVAGSFIASPVDEARITAALPAVARCLVDWVGVCVAGANEPVVRAVRQYTGISGSALPAVVPEAPERAALLNAAAAHALDFDDTYIPADTHFSAVTWATCFALARPEMPPAEFMRAFLVGYEVGAKLAGRRFGFALQFRWFHPTAVLGRISAAAAAAALLKLDAHQAATALAIAATSASGLRSGHGSMAKPLQAGEAARDGVRAALMAAAGVNAPLEVLEPDGGLAHAFVQDGYAKLAVLDEATLGTDWAVEKTSFKPYACLHGIHPSVDAAKVLSGQTRAGEIARVNVEVAPGVKQVARFESPATPLEAKFSVHACVAMALAGYPVGAHDFCMGTLEDPVVIGLMRRIEVIPVKGRKMLDSAIELTLSNGEQMREEVPLSLGHPGNPMTDSDLDAKFLGLINGHVRAPRQALQSLREIVSYPHLQPILEELCAPAGTNT
ncbi:MAG: MmgE/PrpD family protein [Pseudomonadota bacterium]